MSLPREAQISSPAFCGGFNKYDHGSRARWRQEIGGQSAGSQAN